jgi:hypothetical protein
MQETEKRNKPIQSRNTQHIMLVAGEWRKWFPEEQYKVMIAIALNDCVCNEEPGAGKIDISGYLIAGRRIYLVCTIRPAHVKKVLDFFYHKIKEAILHELDKWYQLPGYIEKREQHGMIRMDEIKLFEKLPLHNEWLILLITGRSIKLKYYDPKLARLKRIIRNENFCSAINYAGGEGPVIVRRIYELDTEE